MFLDFSTSGVCTGREMFLALSRSGVCTGGFTGCVCFCLMTSFKVLVGSDGGNTGWLGCDGGGGGGAWCCGCCVGAVGAG